MKNIILKGFGAGVLALCAVSFCSCSKDAKFIGVWTASTPTDITTSVPAATTASALTSVTFVKTGDNARSGSIAISSIINAQQPLMANPVSMNEPYEVSIAATASIAGTWMLEKDSDDDVIVNLDPSSLKVNVDKNGVTFTSNVLTGAQQPVIDSLTNATAAQWQLQLTDAMRREFGRFNKIDDIDVHKDGTMTLETENPDRMLIFRKAE